MEDGRAYSLCLSEFARRGFHERFINYEAASLFLRPLQLFRYFFVGQEIHGFTSAFSRNGIRSNRPKDGKGLGPRRGRA